VEPAVPEVAELRVSLAVRVALAVWPLIAEAAAETVERVEQAALRVLAAAVAAAQRLACHVMAQAPRLVRPAIAAASVAVEAPVGRVVTPVQPDWLRTQQSPRSGPSVWWPSSAGSKNAIGLQGEHIALTLQPNALFLA